MMKRKIFSSIFVGLALGALPFLQFSCDDGRIFDENVHVEREGGTVKLRGRISGIDSWPGGYSIVLAGFEGDNAYAQTAVGIAPEADGTVEMVLSGIPSGVSDIEICAINKLRKRIASFYRIDYSEQADTVYLEAGDIDAGMYRTIQTDIFDRSCVTCHGGSTEAAAGLYLTDDKSYSSLVGVVADRSDEDLFLVEPGNSAESFLRIVLHEDIVRYNHTNIITSGNELDLIDDWIDHGALQ